MMKSGTAPATALRVDTEDPARHDSSYVVLESKR